MPTFGVRLRPCHGLHSLRYVERMTATTHDGVRQTKGMPMGNEVYVGGVKLDIVSGDVSDFDQKVREHLDRGDTWFAYSQERCHYQLHITKATDIIIRYEH